MSHYTTLDDVGPLLDGDRRAVAAFVRVMTPIVQARAAKAMRGFAVRRLELVKSSRTWSKIHSWRFFANESKLLRGWDPDRGLSFQNFVGLIGLPTGTLEAADPKEQSIQCGPNNGRRARTRTGARAGV